MSSLAWLMHSRKWRDSMAHVGPMGGAGVYPAGAGAASTAAGAGAPPPPPKSVLPIIEPAIEPAIDEPKVPIMPAHTQAQQGEEVRQNRCYRRGRLEGSGGVPGPAGVAGAAAGAAGRAATAQHKGVCQPELRRAGYQGREPGVRGGEVCLLLGGAQREEERGAQGVG